MWLGGTASLAYGGLATGMQSAHRGVCLPRLELLCPVDVSVLQTAC